MEAKTVHTATPLALPLVGMKDGVFQETPWSADTDERCAVSESAPIVDANGETVALLVYASDNYYGGSSSEIDERAAFIVRACNAYPDLVKALRMIANGHGCPSALAEDTLAAAEQA